MSDALQEVLRSLQLLEADDLTVVGSTAFNLAREQAISDGDVEAIMKDAHDQLHRNGELSAPIIYEDAKMVAVGNSIDYMNRKSKRHVCQNSVVSINGNDPSYIWDSTFPAFINSSSTSVGDQLFTSALFMLVEDFTVTEREMKYDGAFHQIVRTSSWKIESDRLVRDDSIDVSRLPPPQDSEDQGGGGGTASSPAGPATGQRKSRPRSPAERKAGKR